MLKLRKILLSNYLYIIIIIITIFISVFRIVLPKESLYKEGSVELTSTITNITIDGNKLTLDVTSKEKLLATYYFETEQEKLNFLKTINLGDEILLTGTLVKPATNTTKYLFNYQKYLSYKQIYFILNIDHYEKISSTKNIYYIIKQAIINYFDNNPYLNAFILGDKSYITTEVTNSYQTNGISHLFAISGMHISMISTMLLKILRKFLSEEKSYFCTSLILIFYLLLVGPSPSIIRGVLFFILFSINKIYYFYIKSTNIFLLTLSITILINPFYIFDLGFQFSFLISYVLIYMSESLKGKYLISLLKVSILSFIVSIPISLMNFFQINLLSIIYNLFFVPLVSIIIFPFSLITAFFKFLTPIFNIMIYLLENTSLLLSRITFGQLIFKRLPTFIYLVYLILIFLSLYKLKQKNYKPLILFFILLTIHYLYPSFNKSTYLYMLDVGQGDSILIYSNNEAALIDTGGKTSYSTESWQQTIKNSTLTNNTLLPALKSLGIKKLKYLILTHGDYDHLGEAENLLNVFKVSTIILNQGNINTLEQKIITNYKNVLISSTLNELKVGDVRLIELNSSYDDENTSSQVYLANYKNTNILLMGDATIESEQNILNKYNLPHIDIIKLGHHGSKTSTSEELLQQTTPTLALISCGVDNKFNHPHDEVLEKLSKYNVLYLTTAEEGTISINLKTKQIT